MNAIVFFDVDGVLVKGQTQKFLICYLFEKRKISFFLFLKIYLWFVLYKIGLTKDVLKIRKSAFRQLKGWHISEMKEILKDFFEKKIKPNIDLKTVEIIKSHLNNNDEVVLLSASLKEIVNMIKDYLKLKFEISTELEVKNGVYTGNVKGIIPYGKAKVTKVLEFLDAHRYSLKNSWAYADHISDIHLLELTTHPCVVNPNRELRSIAQKRNWRIYDFR